MLRLLAMDNQAASLGLAIGQPLANARAMLPVLDVVEADERADAQLLARIADWCSRFTPLVALDGGDGLFLDMTGVAHLFGGEKAMLEKIRGAVRRHGFAVQGALAGTAAAARALARYRDGAVVGPGEEAQAMMPLPVEALGIDAVTAHACRRAGLKTVGAVVRRQRPELVARLGAAVMAILDEAMGAAARPLTPRRPPPDYWKERNFAEPVVNEDIIRATLASLTLDLGKVLERHGQGARALHAEFFRSDGAVRSITIRLGAPLRDPAIIARLFREKLGALADPLDPGFGFDLVRLSASEVEPMGEGTGDLYAAPDGRAEIGQLIDRLAARYGSHRILAFQPRDTHVPERAWKAVQAQNAGDAPLPWKKPGTAEGAPRRPLRMFARPEPVEVMTAGYFIWRKARRIVRRCEGPERIAMEWWRHEAPQLSRDYFRVEDSEGRRYWLYRQGSPPRWFVHGTFA
jgi:protein ImuB